MNHSTPLIRQGWLRAIIFLLVWIFIQAISVGIVMLITNSNGANSASINAPTTIMGFVMSLAAVYVFRISLDRKSFSSIGFTWKSNAHHAWSGFFLALLILSAGSLILMTTGNLTFIGFDISPKDILFYFFLLLLVSVSEELVVRGYILNNLMQSINKWIALIISSAVFSLLHLANTDVNWLGMLGIFFGGLLIGLNYIYTKNLWYCIFFHFAWNFFQGPLFGFKVSGIETNSALVQNIHGTYWLTGGPFGFEASALCSILLFAAALGMGFYYYKNQHAFVSEN